MTEVKRTLHIDETERKFTFATVQDVEPILEENKILRGLEQTNTDGMKHKARIPLNLINQWLNEEWARGNTTIRADGPEFEELISRKLTDPAWSALLVGGPSSRVGYS